MYLLLKLLSVSQDQFIEKLQGSTNKWDPLNLLTSTAENPESEGKTQALEGSCGVGEMINF